MENVIVANDIINNQRLVIGRQTLLPSHVTDYVILSGLLHSYLHRPYIFYLDKNTATFGRNILMETERAVNGVLMPSLQIIAKGVVLLLLLALMIAVNPILTLVISVAIGAIYGAIYFILQRKIAKIGREQLEANAQRFKAANEAFGGIKAVKLMGSEDTFEQRYSVHSVQFAKQNAIVEVMFQLPVYALETVAFGGIILIVIYLLGTSGDLAQVLPLVGLFAFAGYRMMPAMQQIYSGATTLRFNLAVLDALHDELRAGAATSLHRDSQAIEPLAFKDRLELSGITFKYTQAAEPVIHDLSLTIKSGSSIAFAGKTGSGKTTISDIILGLLTPDEGNMRVDGVEISPANLLRWQRNLGYVPQDIYLNDDTIASNIAFGVADGKYDMSAVERAAKIANIHEFIVGELPDGYNTIVGERGVRLSGGERQRVGIARALYGDPAVFVLDEATSALDGSTEQSVFNAIENIDREKTMIIIAHRLTTVRKCDVSYLMDDGRIVAQGTYDELMATNIEFQKMARAHV